MDNNPQNRKMMNWLIREQGIVIIEGLLEAPNRIMGAMLIEAIDFDLVILGGGLDNVLPDGSTDVGDGISLAEQLLKKNAEANVVLWSDNQRLQTQFHKLLEMHKTYFLPCFSWLKNISLQQMEANLSLMLSLWTDNFLKVDNVLHLKEVADE